MQTLFKIGTKFGISLLVLSCYAWAQAPQNITTAAGNGLYRNPAPPPNPSIGDGGSATAIGLETPTAVAVDASGNLYIADSNDNRIRKVTFANGAGTLSTVAGDGSASPTTYNPATPVGDGNQATSAQLNKPIGVAVSGTTLYIADSANNRVRQVNLSSGVITTLVGDGNATTGTDGAITSSTTINDPVAVAVDASGNLYIAESGSHLVRKVTFGTNSATLSTVAGGGTGGPGPEGGPATGAQLSGPTGLAVDASGNLYIADEYNGRVRKVTFANGTGTITTVAGNGGTGTPGYSSDGPIDNTTKLNYPIAVALDGSGNLYITEQGASGSGSPTPGAQGNQLIRKVTFGANSATLSTVAGSGITGPTSGTAPVGDGGLAKSAELTVPSGIAIGTSNYLYIADPGNAVVRAVNLNSPLTATPTSLGFGNQTQGSTSAAQTVTLSNTGTVSLNGLSVAISGTQAADFAIHSDNCSSTTLTAGANCAVAVTFTPSTTSAEAATLQITDSNGSSQSIALSGTGMAVVVPPNPTPNVTATPTSLSFGNQTQGSTSAAQTVTLSNTGTGPLNSLSVTISGTQTLDFVQTNNCGSTLAAGAQCTISVTFTPSTTSAEAAAVQITGSNSYSQTVTLSGTGTASTSSPVNSVPTGAFALISVHSGLALDVVGASSTSGARIQQYRYLNVAHDQWTAVAVGNGYYQIVNAFSGKVLDVTGASTANGTPIQQYDYLGYLNQQWQFQAQSDGSFVIVNRLSGKVLDVTGKATAEGALVQQWDANGGDHQKWTIMPITTVQYFTITSKASGKGLDVTGKSMAAGALVQQWDYLAGTNQQWQMIPLGNGYYEILNRNSGLALDLRGASMAAGGVIQQYFYLGFANQQWSLQPTGNGYYQIVNRLSGMVLDVTGHSTNNGTAIQSYTYLGFDNQQWQITPVQ